jgi:hypothetical protein
MIVQILINMFYGFILIKLRYMKTRFLPICLLLCFFISVSPLIADEGMWIPLLIEKYNIKLMQEKGFKLSAEDIYSVNKACMKDAVVMFGSGCTGEVISDNGLLITNHHCGYNQIQKHSSVSNDYLTNGFWAMSKDEELPNPGLTVTFLKRMEDVTDRVLKGISVNMKNEDRENLIEKNISEIRREAVEGTDYSSVIRPFYMGKQYFLFVNETFKDIRLVGAPPSSIGKFGGETDNWVWPRHTGDFSLFRIYSNKENKPSDYSPDNVPFKPVYHFPISVKGAKEGDFTMVFGYPGTTNEYVPSYYIDLVKNYINPKIIDIRTEKIRIMEEAMKSDPAIRIKYSAKKSGIANSWKKWIGENQGLGKMATIKKKQDYEKNLTEWINTDESRRLEYGNILPLFKEIYDSLKVYTLVNNYTNEVFFNNGAEAVGFAHNIKALVDLVAGNSDREKIDMLKMNLSTLVKEFFKNYDRETDKKLFITVMSLYDKSIDPKWQVPEYISLKKSCKDDFVTHADKLFNETYFTDEKKLLDLINNYKASDITKLNRDPFYVLSTGVDRFIMTKIAPGNNRSISELQALNSKYMAVQMEYEKNKVFYPDANSTLRVAYGSIKGYDSEDGVKFKYFTTLKGIMEKDNPAIYDYNVPEKLRQLYLKKDYGNYASNGEVPVCFIADNHTTGGNSGSPVINSEGQLIGINFDRAWEGVASDMAFNPDQSRNISLDIRYALFIIDKFAGAGYLLNEMTIVN